MQNFSPFSYYSRKYPESDGYQKITAKIKIKADGKEGCEEDEYDNIDILKAYDEAIKKRDAKGKVTMSNRKTIEELYNLLGTGGENHDKLHSYFDLYLNGGKHTFKDILQLLEEYEKYKNCINTFREKEFRASVGYSNTTGIIKKIEIQPK